MAAAERAHQLGHRQTLPTPICERLIRQLQRTVENRWLQKKLGKIGSTGKTEAAY